MRSCKTPGITHYSGCDCHEEGWVNLLALERAEILYLRTHLLAAHAKLTQTETQAKDKLDSILEENRKLRLLTENNRTMIDTLQYRLDTSPSIEKLERALRRACVLARTCDGARDQSWSNEMALLACVTETEKVCPDCKLLGEWCGVHAAKECGCVTWPCLACGKSPTTENSP